MKTHWNLNGVSAESFREKIKVIESKVPLAKMVETDRPYTGVVIGACIWQAACVLLEGKAIDHLEKNNGT